jgi:hypothetical protein
MYDQDRCVTRKREDYYCVTRTYVLDQKDIVA